MMYMLMIMTDESSESALSPAAVGEIVAQHEAFGRELRAAGKFVDAHRLHFSREALTIRLQQGKAVVHDGPFAETKEILGGFYLIDVDSREEAIEWAKKLPLRDVGAIEVRPARTGAQWREAAPIRGAMKFVVMFIANYDKPPPRADVFRAIDSHYEISLELAALGKFVGSRSLEPSAAAATLRMVNGGTVVVDGPFAETKEFVAGYFVIACDSRDEAIEWARQLMLGSEVCEVRPVWAE